MATALGLAMQITANTSGMAKATSQVERLLGNLGNAAGNLDKIFKVNLGGSFASLRDSLGAFGVSMPVAAAGIAAVGATAAAVTSQLIALEDRLEKLGNTASQLGVSFGFVQVLEEAANRSGSSIDAVAGGIARLQNSLLGVDDEGKKAQSALQNIGMTVEELRALSPEQQYERLAQKITSIEDPARRTATAIALFGKSGKDLLPFFGNIDRARGDIERLGGAISDIDSIRIAEFGDGVDSVRVATGRLFSALTTTFAGLGEGVTKGLGDAIGGLAAALKPALDALAPFYDALGLVVQVAGSFINVAGNLIGSALVPLAEAGQEASAVINYLATGFENAVESTQQFAASLGKSLGGALPHIALLSAAYGMMQQSSSASLEKLTEDSDEAVKAAAKASQERLALLLNQAASENSIREQIAEFDKNAEKKRLDDLIQQAADAADKQIASTKERQKASQDELAQLLDRAASENNIRDQIEQRDKEIADARARYEERQAEFNRANARSSNDPLRVNDIRSGGIDEVLRLASGREDPGLAEARRQTAELERLRQEVVKLGGTVDILGGA